MAEGSEGRKPAASTRLPHDVYSELEQYCDERDISKADALRRFTEQGLNQAKVQGEFGADRMGVTENVQTVGNLLAIVLALALGLSYLGVV